MPFDLDPGILKRKYGPLPAWGWLALAAGGTYLFIRHRQAQDATATDQQAQDQGNPPQPQRGRPGRPGRSVRGKRGARGRPGHRGPPGPRGKPGKPIHPPHKPNPKTAAFTTRYDPPARSPVRFDYPYGRIPYTVR